MPEGPEVTLMAHNLSQKFKGKTLNKIIIKKTSRYMKPNAKLPINYKEFCTELPLKIIEINNKGKFMYIKLDKDWVIFLTFGLTGHIYYPGKNDHGEYDKPMDKKHNHIEFIVDGKDAFSINDQLKFGTMDFYHYTDLEKKLKKLGPDPITDYKDFDEWKKKFTKKSNLKKEVAVVLLDQDINAGVGNYIRAEVLYNLGWNPLRLVSSLNEKELKDLWKELHEYMKKSYELQKKKKLHEIRKMFKVYKKGTEIRLKGRALFYDPEKQKMN